MINKTIVTETLKLLGVKNDDVLLFHSSFKSFGTVDGGVDAIIDGILDAVAPNGTAVAPTLVQKNFQNAYKTWNKDTSPSDVGYITEIFRLRKNALRSDHATHSVSAIGRLAKEITSTHQTSTPRIHPYGEYAFSKGSPWQKMYDLNGKVVFMGIDLKPNTYRHFVEALYLEKIIEKLESNPNKQQLLSKLVTHSDLSEYDRQINEEKNDGKKHTLIRFLIKNLVVDADFPKKCTLKTAYCENTPFTLFNIRDFVDSLLEVIFENPANYFTKDVIDWINKVYNAN